MRSIINNPANYIAEFMYLFILLVFVGAFLSPLFFKLGLEAPAESMQGVYRVFCHQRVERSLFMFGELKPIGFYTIDELRAADAIPSDGQKVPSLLGSEIYAYPYWGNEAVGYKVALCIRDIALYAGMLLAGSFYFLMLRKGKVTKIPFKYLVVLMLPMVLDVAIQITVQAFDLGIDVDPYVNNIVKRVVTGLFFGIGFGYFVFPTIKEQTI